MQGSKNGAKADDLADALSWCAEKLEGFKPQEINYNPEAKGYAPLLPIIAGKIIVMENKEELTNRLKNLLKRKEEFSTLLENFNFQTKKEADDYITNNQSKFDELKKLTEEIREVKFLLMNPQEKKEYLEEKKKIKEKYSDD